MDAANGIEGVDHAVATDGPESTAKGVDVATVRDAMNELVGEATPAVAPVEHPYVADPDAAVEAIAAAMEPGGVAGESGAGEPDSSGWLIEAGWTPVFRPDYVGLNEDGKADWVADPNDALRMARKVDAERVAKVLMPSIDVRIAEHGFAAWGSYKRPPG